MGSSPFLTDPTVPLVADTSTVINVIATGRAQTILDAVPNPIVVVDVVPDELDAGRPRGRQHADRLLEIVSAGHIEVVGLGDIGSAHFEMLVVGPAQQTLDDGEAATIACAIERSAVAILDEKKATRICGERFPSLITISTVDLLLHPEVRRLLGDDALSDAVFSALKEARMAVSPHHLDEILRLIGPERALQCQSLPKGLRIAAQTVSSPGSDRGA